ncbi:MAG: P-II family nitrogen regulator [Rhodospirillales bacterium]|nr:P-II family nitrogen regulator [Rhodospirillales bacterium]
MKFKLIVALVDDHQTGTVLKTAREGGATGATVITSARGEGLKPAKTFFGLDLEAQRDMVLLLVEAHLSRRIIEAIAKACEFDETPGTGIAFQVDIEDAVGLSSQIGTISSEIEEEI